MVLLLNFNKASREPDFFKRTAKETFGFTLVLGFLSDLYVLSVPIEFVGQGIVAVLAAVSAFATHQRGSAEARKVADGCLGVVGLTILALALVGLATNWSNKGAPDLARQLLMPAWMTLGVLPFIYAVALYASYEMAFKWIGFRNSATFRARCSAKAAVVVRLRGQATLVDKFDPYWGTRSAEAGSFCSALAVVDEFKEGLVRREQERQDAAERLIRFAGVDGVDDESRRLHRREFDETTRALRWIGTCQMGWGRGETGYRADILDVLGDLGSHGLPGDGGITVRVSSDGGSWYAWRRTPSGWVFAIGAAGPLLISGSTTDLSLHPGSRGRVTTGAAVHSITTPPRTGSASTPWLASEGLVALAMEETAMAGGFVPERGRGRPAAWMDGSRCPVSDTALRLSSNCPRRS